MSTEPLTPCMFCGTPMRRGYIVQPLICPACVATLAGLIARERTVPVRLPSCPDCGHAWANHGPTPIGEPVGCSLCPCKKQKWHSDGPSLAERLAEIAAKPDPEKPPSGRF